MPAKNTIKAYEADCCYHLYNRGVDKRVIFQDQKDCIIFLYYLKLYLSPPEVLQQIEQFMTPRMLYKINNLNLSKEIDLLSFALMPNHFHMQVRQYTTNGIEKLMRRVLTSYAQYFNKKYNRVGVLFESAYKAVKIETDEQHLYLSSYIHRNPIKLTNPRFDFIQFSSYPYYLGNKTAAWIRPNEIQSYFKTIKQIKANDVLSYQSFVESFQENHEDIISTLTLEDSA